MKTKKLKLYSGARKTAKATDAISDGNGKIWINKTPVEIFEPIDAQERILTPIILAGELRNKINIDVTVSGGGYMGQADACSIAITKAIEGFTKGSDFKKLVNKYDKHLLSGDPRRKESKKFGGPSARTRKQKSYR